MSDRISAIIAWFRSLPVAGKVISVIIVTLLAVLVCVSCTTSRNVSLSVDKAESVNIQVQDSVSAAYPVF